MDLKENSLVKITNNINNQKEIINKKDYRFFHIETILKIAKYSQKLTIDCETCKDNLKTLEELTTNIPSKINTLQGRKKFTNTIDKIALHLRKEHNIYFTGYYLALYSLFAIIAGTATGAFIGWAIDVKYIKFGLLIGFTIGLIIGRIFGKIKENKLKKENLLI